LNTETKTYCFGKKRYVPHPLDKFRFPLTYFEEDNSKELKDFVNYFQIETVSILSGLIFLPKSFGILYEFYCLLSDFLSNSNIIFSLELLQEKYPGVFNVLFDSEYLTIEDILKKFPQLVENPEWNSSSNQMFDLEEEEKINKINQYDETIFRCFLIKILNTEIFIFEKKNEENEKIFFNRYLFFFEEGKIPVFCIPNNLENRISSWTNSYKCFEEGDYLQNFFEIVFRKTTTKEVEIFLIKNTISNLKELTKCLSISSQVIFPMISSEKIEKIINKLKKDLEKYNFFYVNQSISSILKKYEIQLEKIELGKQKKILLTNGPNGPEIIVQDPGTFSFGIEKERNCFYFSTLTKQGEEHFYIFPSTYKNKEGLMEGMSLILQIKIMDGQKNIHRFGTLTLNEDCSLELNWNPIDYEKYINEELSHKNIFLRIDQISNNTIPNKFIEYCVKKSLEKNICIGCSYPFSMNEKEKIELTFGKKIYERSSRTYYYPICCSFSICLNCFKNSQYDEKSSCPCCITTKETSLIKIGTKVEKSTSILLEGPKPIFPKEDISSYLKEFKEGPLKELEFSKLSSLFEKIPKEFIELSFSNLLEETLINCKTIVPFIFKK